ncbi:zinc finger BED domain-containing protein RICESLEEPER 2-like protein [Tanacetum coccineum]
MKASSSNLRYADNNDAIDDHIEVVKTVDDHDVVDVDSENANGVGDEKTVDNEKKGGRRSFVWDHFIFVKGATKAPCPYCKTVIACAGKKNGTSTLASHLTNVCRTSPLYKKNIDSKKQATLGFKPISEGDITGGSLATHSFSQERCRKALARLCIKDNQPFSIVDNEGFQDYSWEMNPLFKMPSRWTVARDCLKIYKEEEKKLKGLLKDQTVSLTTDTWSSVQNVNYMCLTAHWVDDDWVLRKKILNFCPIANHRGDTIGKMVYQCLQKWGIERVFTVTVDNASSNDGAIKFLGKMLKGPHAVLDCKYLHLRCCAHILNLVVRDGLEEQFKSISKIRNAVRYVRSSPARAASFRESVERVNIQCDKKPCLDVETRWNSTFLMLETAEKYADAFDRLKLIDYKYRSYFCGDDEDDFADNTRKRKRKEKVVGAPEEDDWEKARHFIEYLRVFYNVTNLISGSKYVTSNLFFGELVTMHASISRMCADEDEQKRAMAASMKDKYDKYWDNIDNINFLLYVAVLLDPRNKLFYLDYCLGQIYGMNSAKTKVMSKKVVETLNELFQHYRMKEDRVNARNKKNSAFSTSDSSLFTSGAKVSLETSFLKYLEEQGHGVNKTEVDIYLDDGLEKRDDSFDILNWWKVNSLKFPILSQVARHVLGMPISTVASESAFSTGGRVIDQFRSSLTPKTAEALICVQDWIRSTPTDIGLQDMPVNVLEELQEKIEKIELDEFPTGQKSFESMDED